VFHGCINVDGDAPITLPRHCDGQRNKFAGLSIERRGLRTGAVAQKVPTYWFVCATSVFSVSLWRVFARNSSTTETQRTQRLHREEGLAFYHPILILLFGSTIEQRTDRSSKTRKDGCHVCGVYSVVPGEVAERKSK
jgi:hypothetical protein